MQASLRYNLAQSLGKTAGALSRRLGFGEGAVLPGTVALRLAPKLIYDRRSFLQRGCIVVTGTNGKSTTTALIVDFLRSSGYSVCTNPTGANMANGIATTLIELAHQVDYGVFEIDEAVLPKIVNDLQPTHAVILNFTRDQMDRYAEIDQLLAKISQCLDGSRTEIIYNYGNSKSALVGLSSKKAYGYYLKPGFKEIDQTICPSCSRGLLRYVTHLSTPRLYCSECQTYLGSPNLILTYDKDTGTINGESLAARAVSQQSADSLSACVLLADRLQITKEKVINYSFHRIAQEAHQYDFQRSGDQRSVMLQLAKNPVSFNAAIDAANRSKAETIMFAVNHNLADGHDTSWLWDVDFERLGHKGQIAVYGQGSSDLLVRLQVAGLRMSRVVTPDSLAEYIRGSQTLFIAANYTAYREIEFIVRSLEDRDREITSEAQIRYGELR